ncbi:phosphatidylinositol-specific phospholipase C1-like protein [Akkermansiaceae bacterium]|jgi:hypothetical protein|nr:phosphatidylinositol-specific phospholipase C1-like protein [Akkermansiaceae bacterium]MDC0568074.1 phosphatidylinositol-specific phospholipase C1-like protein [Akkermansiaceae bacterium]
MKIFLFLLFMPFSIQGELRLNQIQIVGTHNSYHVAPTSAQMNFLGMFSKEAATAWDYTRKSLGNQLDNGLRHFELDVYADPEGGLFSSSSDPIDSPLRKPGMKVLHVPKLDAKSVHLTFKSALDSVKKWSDENANHLPVMILVELKDRAENPLGPKPLKFDRAQMEALEKEILSVLDLERIITPDFVRGNKGNLRDVIIQKGWPVLKKCRGKIMFCLDNEGSHLDEYLKKNPSLEERLLFVSVGPDHPAAAWMKRNDPIAGFREIQQLVKAGFMVRTRADTNTVEARANDKNRANKALASGAQFVSTDFPDKVPRISEYEVRLPGRMVARANPVLLPDLKEKAIK